MEPIIVQNKTKTMHADADTLKCHVDKRKLDIKTWNKTNQYRYIPFSPIRSAPSQIQLIQEIKILKE